jgi:hypothetical protein
MKDHHSYHVVQAVGAAMMLFLIVGALTGGTAAASPLTHAPAPTPTSIPVRVPTEPDVPSVYSNAISEATAQQLALAMDVPNSDILAADLMGSDASGTGVGNAALGEWFPTKGGAFAILSTGHAADASLPDSSGSLSTVLGGIDNQQGNDLVRLHLQLRAPGDMNCLSVDFAFYSEEFPEWVNSQFNDRFTVQLNDSSLSITGNEVVAPGNFAFDTNNNIISVNTVFGVHSPTGTTYDGVTPRLRARTTVTPNATIDLYWSIQDIGDSIYDSTVFLDNFFWSKDPLCKGGSQADSDGDGLMDDWETNGLTVSVGGVDEFVDLPAMGANPQHKDAFVEIDYMGAPAPGGHTHRPAAAAIQTIVNAFNNAPVSNPDGTTGIHLHVDYGSTAPLTWGSTPTWGTLSHADEIAHTTNLGTSVGSNYNWSAFDVIKQDHFTPGRAAVFHYNVWAHDLAIAFGGTSGISRNSTGADFGSGSSDFIVSLGSWTGQTGSENEQAGTFMHEFGHNLGLRHGGVDHTQWKPNYLSVMNYAMQTRGLIINSTVGNFDYSRYDLADLDENNLNETVGINIPDTITDTLGTYYFCGVDNLRQITNARTADWNCDNDSADASVSRNINQGMSWNNNGTLDTLTSQNDWDNLVYSGGAISQPGAVMSLPQESEVIDIDKTEDAAIPNILPFINASEAKSMSNGSQDGYVLESTGSSRRGGVKDSKAKILKLGNDVANKQYRSVLSFNTGADLPDNAKVTKVTLKFKFNRIIGGGNPVKAFGGFMVDIKTGPFGKATLETGDFQAKQSKSFGPLKYVLAAKWYSIDLTAAKDYINLLDLTQIRLRFKSDDNNNLDNILQFYSGNAGSDAPQLIVEYTP